MSVILESLKRRAKGSTCRFFGWRRLGDLAWRYTLALLDLVEPKKSVHAHKCSSARQTQRILNNASPPAAAGARRGSGGLRLYVWCCHSADR